MSEALHCIIPESLLRATIKRRGNILSPSSTQAFRPGQICPIFLFSFSHWSAAGQASQHDRAYTLSLSLSLSLRLLAAGKTSQHEGAHSLFFTDSLSRISSSPLSTMRRPHQIYGPLVSGKSFFHHSSFLLNQQILGETNWIFSTPALTSAFLFQSWRQHLNSYFDFSNFIPSQLNICSSASCDLQHKGSFRLKLLIKLPNWKLSISSSTRLFFLLI